MIGFVVAAATIIFVWWFIADNRTETQALESRQDELQSYTTELRSLVQELAPVASELGTAGTLSDADLTEKATEWKNDVATVQTSIGRVVPPTELDALNGLVTQSVLLYGQSAEQYELVPDLEGRLRERVSAKALATYQAAENIFASVIEIVDRERSSAELSASGLTTPAQEAAAIQPSGGLPGAEGSDTLEIPPAEEGGSGGGGDEGSGGGGNEGSGGGGNGGSGGSDKGNNG